jgi:RHS repeat-associated protein
LTYVARRWVWHQIGRSCDRLSRVTGTFSGYAREDIVHDTNGNRLRVERRTVANAVSPSQVDTYQLAPGTNRLTAITGASGSRSFAYDLRGNLTGETRSTGPAVAVTYDGRGRLTAYASAGASQTMTYNGADERVRVVTAPASGPVDTRVYVYDLDHRIIGEYGPGGNADVRAEYIWTLPEVGASGPMGADDGTGGYMPLAVAVGSGAAAALHWVHADHMGVPLVTTNATGAVVTPTGYALSGFPGQFANAVLLPGAAHYYNRYRDCDPTTGRYIQADPIGLEGDANPYAYALGNPLRYTDPSGEWANLAIGAGIGFGTDLASQLAANRGNWRCIRVGQLAAATAFGAVGGGLGGKGLAHGLRMLPRSLKGSIGEALSVAENTLKGSRLLDRQFRGIPGQSTVADSVWRSLSGGIYYVESKFGLSTLTAAQRRAASALGSQYKVERWGYPFFGRVGAYLGGGGASSAFQSSSPNGCGCG